MSDTQANSGIPAVTVLHGYTSMATAHLTEDYPYGRRLRCQRREWLEYKPRQGYRLVTQTTDPKRPCEHWNAPKASTYCDWAVMTQDPNPGPTFGHIGWTGLGIWGPDPAQHVRLALSGVIAQLDIKELKFYRLLLRISQEKARTSSWERWRETTRLMRDGALTRAEFPTADELTAAGHYIDARDWEAAAAQIAAGFDAFTLPELPAAPAAA